MRWVSTTKWGASFPSVTVSGAYVDWVNTDVGNSTTNVLLTLDGNYSRAIGNHVHNQNSTCGGNGGAGIEAQGWQSGGYNGTGMEIIGNLVEDIGIGPRDGTCSLEHGIYTSVPYVTVANNVVRRAIGVGITQWHAAAYNTIVNNTLVDNGSYGIMIGNGDQGASVAQGNYTANNVATGNVYQAVAECCGGTSFGTNTYVDNQGYDNGAGNSSSTLIGNAHSGAKISGSLYADPRFVSSTDLHLQSSSPSIDSGTTTNAPGTDFDGTARPQGSGDDRGAYEYVVSGGGSTGGGSTGGGSTGGGSTSGGSTGGGTTTTTTTHVTDADTFVRADEPSTNFGNDAELQLDGDPIRRTLLHFISLPSGAKTVKLRVYSTFSTGQSIEVHASSCNWEWDTVTYNTAPAPGALLATYNTDTLGWNELTLPASSVPSAGGVACLQLTKRGDLWGNLASIGYGDGTYGPRLVITR